MLDCPSQSPGLNWTWELTVTNALHPSSGLVTKNGSKMSIFGCGNVEKPQRVWMLLLLFPFFNSEFCHNVKRKNVLTRPPLTRLQIKLVFFLSRKAFSVIRRSLRCPDADTTGTTGGKSKIKSVNKQMQSLSVSKPVSQQRSSHRNWWNRWKGWSFVQQPASSPRLWRSLLGSSRLAEGVSVSFRVTKDNLGARKNNVWEEDLGRWADQSGGRDVWVDYARPWRLSVVPGNWCVTRILKVLTAERRKRGCWLYFNLFFLCVLSVF